MSGGTQRQAISNVAALALRTLVVGLALYGGLDLMHGAMAQDDDSLYLPAVIEAEEVQSLETRVAALEDLLANVSRDGNEIYVTGANLHVVNGTGATETTNGLGIVIIGYNETTGELVVSDSWGPSYERRWVPVKVASWASQGSIFMILP